MVSELSSGAQFGMGVGSGLQAIAGIINAATQAEAIRTQQRLLRKALQRRIDLMKHRRKEVRRAGDLAESAARQRTRQLVGAQRAAMAAQGISLGSFTSQQLQQEAIGIGQLDALTIRNNARRQMLGMDLQIGETQLEKRLSVLDQQTRAMGTIVGGTTSSLSKFGKDIFNITEG